MSSNICFYVLPNQHDRHVSCWPTYWEKKNNYQFFKSSLTCSKSGLLTESYISHLINCIAYNSWNNPIHCSVYIIFKIVKPLGIFWFWILILIEQKQTNKQLVYKKKTFCISLLAFTYIFLIEPPFHCICSMCKVICPLQHLSWGIFRKKKFFFFASVLISVIVFKSIQLWLRMAKYPEYTMLKHFVVV